MDIHDRIAHARRMAGLTQDDVADHFKIRRASVAQWEGKRSKPSVDKIIELAKLLGTTPEWLVDERGNAPAKRERDPATGENKISAEKDEFLSLIPGADDESKRLALAILRKGQVSK